MAHTGGTNHPGFGRRVCQSVAASYIRATRSIFSSAIGYNH